MLAYQYWPWLVWNFNVMLKCSTSRLFGPSFVADCSNILLVFRCFSYPLLYEFFLRRPPKCHTLPKVFATLLRCLLQILQQVLERQDFKCLMQRVSRFVEGDRCYPYPFGLFHFIRHSSWLSQEFTVTVLVDVSVALIWVVRWFFYRI